MIETLPQLILVANKDGTITLNVLSTGSSGGDFGAKTYTLTKQKDGSWKANNGQVFRGFGQMHNTEKLEDEK